MAQPTTLKIGEWEEGYVKTEHGDLVTSRPRSSWAYHLCCRFAWLFTFWCLAKFGKSHHYLSFLLQKLRIWFFFFPATNGILSSLLLRNSISGDTHFCLPALFIFSLRFQSDFGSDFELSLWSSTWSLSLSFYISSPQLVYLCFLFFLSHSKHFVIQRILPLPSLLSGVSLRK